ncbi:hypothetical protein GIB67_003240 [Kingdonia uniflora]|uniref:Clu domain-containing protein n=1 Tax=Kingdonia uniflora TaxID=39325 RepID=A0A7J7LH50_9MAGN|nr:hypothetical protein GIB67_003240 [Kingdonia uniflora]
MDVGYGEVTYGLKPVSPVLDDPSHIEMAYGEVVSDFTTANHKRDAARAENALTLSFGSELVGMQRDWNEELQSCREFPHTTPQESSLFFIADNLPIIVAQTLEFGIRIAHYRSKVGLDDSVPSWILRDRALYKVTCDFVDAAVSGAVGVISRCIPPINPTDPECFHMYVHNNIFFSFAVDADFEQLFKNHAPIVELRPVKEDISNIPKTDKIHDVAPDTAESQFTDSEQATYASANNDLKGTRAYQEADVPGLYSLAMAIIDYRGHRLVAQSIIPGILQGDKSDSLLYGSVDNGKKICWNETFHSKVLEAAKHLHLKEHTVLDGSGKGVKLAAPVECKGIVGTDDRHYLLDLMRATPRDANYMGPESRFCVLRPELVNAFCQAEAAERLNCRSKSDEEVPVDTASLAVAAEADLGICVVENTEIPNPQVGATESRLDEEVSPIQDCNSATAEDVATSEEILLNPNVFTEFKLAGSEEEIAADKENVRKVGLHLKNVVLPKFIQDLCTLEVSPMDGQTLTEALHAHGINVRYIGEVANMTKHLPHVWDLCATEIVVRCAKHILKGVLRESQDHDIAIALAHFFNCFFGTKVAVNNLQSETPKKASHQALVASRKSGISSRKNQSPYVHNKQSLHLAITSESLWSDIEEFAKLKYQFDLPVDAKSWVKKVSVIRNLCQKVGITIAARKYDLNVTDPFQTDDILNLQPVVKHSVPVCSEARDLVETGKARLGEGLLNEAYTLFSEAFSILQQVCSYLFLNFCSRVCSSKTVTGPMHREVANCCSCWSGPQHYSLSPTSSQVQIFNPNWDELSPTQPASSPFPLAEGLMFGSSVALPATTTREPPTTVGLITEPTMALPTLTATTPPTSAPVAPPVSVIRASVTGTHHSRYLAMVLYHAGDMAGAIMQQHKELIINERCLGLDHPDTAHSYGNMALFYHGLNQTELALRHMSRTLLLLSLSSGSDHPDVAATFINVAMMYQDIGKMNTALRYLQDALKKNERLLGEDHIQTAHEKKTYDILVKQLGEGDLRTRDSQNWINTFKMRDLQVNAQKQKGQAVDAASTQRAIEILKANPELIQAFQAAAAAGGTGIGKGSTGMAGEAIPRGRGVDERAGRATAEVRKKALAKGLLVRPQGVAVQALQPPLTQLINIINEQADESAKESNGSIINSPEESKENGSFTGQEEQAPVGLGSGLTALESKKQKRKSGGTAS